MPTLALYLLIFFGVGIFFLFFHLMLGKMVRPAKPDPDKLTIYECGEPTVGSAWVQFDLRYYVVALLFVIFDVEVAFFFPWAVVFGGANNLSRDLDPQAREALTRELVPASIPPIGEPMPQVIARETAHNWAWVGFIDILIFFGVLMVGFAYLWKRGDIDWVRSTTAAQPQETGPPEVPAQVESRELVGAGRDH